MADMRPVEGATIHFGLDVATARTVLKRSNVQLLTEWARSAISAHDIRIDTPNYEVLLQAPDAFEVYEITERQNYFRMILAACVENQHRATAENDECVYPTQQTILTRQHNAIQK